MEDRSEGKDDETRWRGDRGQYKQVQNDLAPPDAREERTKEIPNPVVEEKTNILFHPTPHFTLPETTRGLGLKSVAFSISLTLVLSLVSWRLGSGGFGAVFSGCIVFISVWLWMRHVIEELEDRHLQTEKQRGEYATLNLIPESVEWMNTLINTSWSLINPDVFASMSDTLEDVMQASVPSIIENVRVADIGHGNHPLRVLSLRALPDSEVSELKGDTSEDDAEKIKAEEREIEEEDDDSLYYNLECALAYYASSSGSGMRAKAQNMHLQIVFYLGIRGVVGIPLPIWVEIKGLVVTVRLRFQLSPNPPFLKNVTFTLMGLPNVKVSAVPMTQKGINVLNLPLISNFVDNSIKAAANEYVAPRSMSMDLSKILQGDDIKKDTNAMGVLYIKINRAHGLSKQDRRGSSDAYITIAFAKYGKPLYSTRVIVNDLNPIWEESTAILVLPEDVKAQESLSIQLWDSDRLTADDLVGRVEFNLHDLLKKSGDMIERKDSLLGEDEGSSMPGTLIWAIGYFDKAAFDKSRRTHGLDVNVPQGERGRSALQDEKGALDSEVEFDTVHIPPDPDYPSGIISIVVHQIVNLEVQNPTGSYGRHRLYMPGQETGESKEEESKTLPSSYCCILLNDALVFRTRTKMLNGKPIFNAGTERFVRDWRNAVVVVAVRESRKREHSPLLGVVYLKLSEIFQTSSQVTKVYAIEGGLGYGRARISVLFRSVNLQLDCQLLGWDIGTLEILNEIKANGISSKMGSARIVIRTGVSNEAVARKNASQDGDTTIWNLGDEGLHLPIKYRYMSAVVMEFRLKATRKPHAYSILWLKDIVDNEENDHDLPLWQTDNPHRLINNCITEKEENMKEIGRVKFKSRYTTGLDDHHEPVMATNDERDTMETYDACVSLGLRAGVIHKETNQVVEELESGGTVNEDSDIADEDNDILRSDQDKTDRERGKNSGDQDSAEWKELGKYADSDSSDEDEDQESSLGQRLQDYRKNQKTLHRKQRGLMQWRPSKCWQSTCILMFSPVDEVHQRRIESRYAKHKKTAFIIRTRTRC